MTSSRQAHEIPQSPEGDGEPQYASKTPWVAFMRRHIWAVAVVFGVVMITGLRSPLIRRPDAPEVLAGLDARLRELHAQAADAQRERLGAQLPASLLESWERP